MPSPPRADTVECWDRPPVDRAIRAWVARATEWPVVRRALACALVVGPVLIAINHGGALLRGDISGGQLLQMALTLMVPYAVSTLSSA